jgi:hypothetical protein
VPHLQWRLKLDDIDYMPSTVGHGAGITVVTR